MNLNFIIYYIISFITELSCTKNITSLLMTMALTALRWHNSAHHTISRVAAGAGHTCSLLLQSRRESVYWTHDLAH